jgi:hypothetical protein
MYLMANLKASLTLPLLSAKLTTKLKESSSALEHCHELPFANESPLGCAVLLLLDLVGLPGQSAH